MLVWWKYKIKLSSNKQINSFFDTPKLINISFENCRKKSVLKKILRNAIVMSNCRMSHAMKCRLQNKRTLRGYDRV